MSLSTARLDTAATLKQRDVGSLLRDGGSRTLDDVDFFDDDESEWYTFEWWRRLMEGNRPVNGICAGNRDWIRVAGDGSTSYV